MRYSDAGKQLPIGNGGVGPGGVYWWTQTLHEVLLHVAVPAGVRSKKQLSVRVDRRAISIKATLPGPLPTAAAAAAAATSGTAATAAAGASETVVLLSGPLYGPVAVDRETCGPDGVMWSWDKEPGAGGERPRLPPPAALPPLPESTVRTLQSTAGCAGAGGSAVDFHRLQAVLWLPSTSTSASASASGTASASASATAPHLLPGGGVLTVPLEKLEDTWWRRITAHPDGGVPGALAAAAEGASAAAEGASGGAAGDGAPSPSAASLLSSLPVPAGIPSPSPSPSPAAVASLCLLPGPWDIDASAVDSTREVTDYDPDTQAAIRRIVYEQCRGTPGHEIENQLKAAEAERAQAAAREHAHAAATTTAAAPAKVQARTSSKPEAAAAAPSVHPPSESAAAAASAAPQAQAQAPPAPLAGLSFPPEDVARDPSLLWGTGGTAATRSPPDSDDDNHDDGDDHDHGDGDVGKPAMSTAGPGPGPGSA